MHPLVVEEGVVVVVVEEVDDGFHGGIDGLLEALGMVKQWF